MKPIADAVAQVRKTIKRRFDQQAALKKRRSQRRKFQPAIERLENRQLLAASYLAPAEPTGNVDVRLDPLANVTAGVQEIVTFGVPFTRGSVSQSQLSQVRVLKNGLEIPAFVEQLTPWRSIDDAGIDGQSVRVARIQIPYTFSALAPETISVHWGGPARTLNRATMQDPRLEWHTVTSGSFVAADNVEEPDVLPVLPKEYLSKGMLNGGTQPMSGGVAETRDDPAAMDAMTFSGYAEYDYAQKNFFYTTINQNPGITIDYKTQSEPWLYDRSSGMYGLYLRSGFGVALREAIRSTDFYVDHLDASGSFTLKPGDPKYSYNEPLAYAYWLLGDNRMLAPVSTVVNAFNGTATHWTPNLSFWTERNVGYKLLANEIAYEVTGNATFKTNVQTIVNDLIWHQNGAGGQLPINRIDGGLYHIGEQHDASEVDDPNVIVASSWMSALIVDPMVRAYGVWQSPQIADFLVRMGNFVRTASKTDADGQFDGVTRYPDYLMRFDGTTENRSDTDVQHAMDVGAIAAWATYFAELRGTPDASLRQLANDLYATYDVGVNFWTRPGGTNFNVSPPRRYTWEYKNSASFSWALTGADAGGQPGLLQFNAASYSANENGGAATITVTRTGGSAGSVSVNFATSNGTATAGSDYTAASGTLTFAAGETSKTFTVAVLDDSTVEGNESLALTLSNPTGGATLGSPASVTFTIVDNDSSPSVALPAGFTQSVVATGISSGTALSVAPDGRIFVLEQGGAVRVIKNGALLGAPAITVPTASESERGLLGITFDPNFSANHDVYIYYTVGGPSPSPAHNRVSRFTLNGDVAVPGSEAVLLELPDTTYRIHNGGALEFGADGKLYIAVGNDVEWNNAQELTNPFGKILRINADGTIPADNPFYNQTTGVNRAIWAIGLRNPYTFDVQPGTGLMYINDVGEASWEEINQGTAGANYGWPNGEGYTTNPQYRSPVYAYGHGAGPNQGFAIVGGAFYNPTTTTFPSQYVGKYFFMDYVNGWISYVDPAAANPKAPTSFASNIPTRYDGGPVDLEVGADGAMYYLNRLGGGVFKIQYQAPPATGSFTNVTVSSGVDAIIDQKYQETPNWWLSGQHLVDLDNDGDLDLYLSNHGGGSVVALNNGSGVFTRITTGSFPDSEIHQMYDVNEDGKVDVSMTYQDGGGRWWINNSTPGAVNFSATNVTRGGNTSRSQVMLDFNGDGKADWLRSAPPGLVVDFGNGSGGFAEGSLTFPVPGTTSNENASFLPADYDDDGDVDLLILTGGGYDGTVGKTSYWRNNGDLTFTDVTAGAGIPANGTLAKGIGDYDQDGDTDFIAIENKSMPPAIYLNNGQGVFAKQAGAISGVAAGTMDYSAWGTAISTDFDNDGIVDVIMDGKYYLKVLRGTGGGNFTYMNTTWGIRDTAASAVDDGLCFGDFDGDGDLDVIGYNETFPTRTLNVYRNDLAPRNWLNVRPVGVAGNKGAARAKISVYAAGTNQLLWYEQVATYDFQVATSYYGYGETERHFGLGTRANVDVVVEFPGMGRVTRINNVAANQTIRVLENAGEITADFNGDGAVGAADLAVWRASFPSGAAGDADGDNDADGADFLAWQRQLGLQNAQPAVNPALADAMTPPASEARTQLAAHDALWESLGADGVQLAGIHSMLTDLSHGMFVRPSGKRMGIDRNVAGHSWLVDAALRANQELSAMNLPADVDLWSEPTDESGCAGNQEHDDDGLSAALTRETRLATDGL